MHGVRCDRILAGTALALLLAAPWGAMAQEAKVAAVPMTASPTEQPQAQAPATREAPATEPGASAPGDASSPPAGNAEPPTEPTSKPDAMASLDPADRSVAEKIRDLLASGRDRIFASKRERQAVEAFYQKRQFAPLWLDKGVENARKAAVIARLRNAEADGLEAGDYKVPNFTGGNDALAEAELKLTQSVVTYSRHLQAGRFPYQRVSHNIELPQTPPDAEQVLAKISKATDPGAALDELAPPHEAYRELKAMLAAMRGKSSRAAKGELPEGPVLTYDRKHQMEDGRVPQLRERLGLSAAGSDLRYDLKLSEVVKKFQRAHELPATGNLDARTVRELNGPKHDRQIETVIANMERWRWYPRDLGEAHVVVNEPDFTLKVVHKGAQVWTTRVVIGKPSKATPLLSETMKYITVNPTWNVPPSIVYGEYLPALAQDPTVLARMGLRVHYDRGGGMGITQPPGEGNALGRLRFNFPNRFLVYQHDTPDKYMFAHDARAYSHGCMRVQDPAKYAEVLLNIARPDEQWTAEKIKGMFGGAEHDLQIQPVPIWVHLTYQTAFVDNDGKLQIRRDLYNLDSRLLAAIKSERGLIEPPEHKQEQEIASGSGHRRTARYSRGDVFQSLFGAPSYYAPRARRAGSIITD
jgi:murein L,D-transpeptidase YcbB/YkuD